MSKVTFNPDGCYRCELPASHKIYRGNIGERLCCACYVAGGYAPADWHPECMRQYRLRRELLAEDDAAKSCTAAQTLDHTQGD